MTVRPLLHLTPRAGWINDPLALTWHDGRYHVFFQYVPGSTDWAPDCRWGHATSGDGLVWREGPVALEPGDGDDGCWSGCLVRAEGRGPRIFYTSVSDDDVQLGAVRVADAADASWEAWTKGAVVAGPPAGEPLVAYRDPWVFRDRDGWTMLVGAGRTDGAAVAFAYTSPDLDRWTYAGPFLSRSTRSAEPVWTGEVWECPQFFRVDGVWALVVSVWRPGEPQYEAYALGRYEDGVFTPGHWGRLTYGPSYYAGSAFVDRDGAPGIVYWLRGVADPESGWVGAHSVPHRLRLAGSRIVAEPTPAVAARRGPGHRLDGAAPIDVTGPVDVVWNAGAGPCGLVLSGPDGASCAEVTVEDRVLRVAAGATCDAMPAGDGPLRVLVDGPVLEVFAETGTFAAPLRADPGDRTLRVVGDCTGELYRLRGGAVE